MIFTQSLDGRDARTLGLRRGHQTGADRLPVDEHRAGAAFTLAAPFLGPRERARFPQHVEQPRHRRDVHRDLVPVQVEAHAASITCSGSAGMFRASMPRWRIAFTMAGAGPSIGSSPSPLAPKGPPT